MKKICIFLLIASAVFSAFPETLKNVPYIDPVYDYLEEAYACGRINYLPQTKPYTEKQILGFLDEIEDHYDEFPGESTTERKDLLESFSGRFRGNRYRFIETKDTGDVKGALGWGASFNAASPLNRLGDSVPRFTAKLSGELAYADSMYMRLEFFPGFVYKPWTTLPYRKFFAPYRDDQNVYTWFFSSDTAAFNHSAKHIPGEQDLSLVYNLKNQIAIDAGIAVFQAARESLSWGPGNLSNLGLSSTSKPYDYISLNMPIGVIGSFSWMTGFLQDYMGLGSADTGKKLVSSHRVELQIFPWLMFSIYESIVYSQRFEISYINPLSFYMVSEVTNGDYDNKLGGADFVFRFLNTKLYLSLLADDWDIGEFFNFNYFHNEMGLIAGFQIYELMPGVRLDFEYAYMSHWMYTHRNDIAAGAEHNHNSYTHFGSHLGHFLEPNSHMAFTGVNWNIGPQTSVGTSFWFTQDSFGDVDTPPQDVGWDINGLYTDWVNSGRTYNFLDFGIDGIIRETNIDWTVYIEHFIPYFGVKLHAGYSLEYTINAGKVEGTDKLDHIITLEGIWSGY